MEKIKNALIKIGAWVKSHKVAVAAALFLAVALMLASCQGLANVNGEGNTMIIGEGNSNRFSAVSSFNEIEADTTTNLN